MSTLPNHCRNCEFFYVSGETAILTKYVTRREDHQPSVLILYQKTKVCNHPDCFEFLPVSRRHTRIAGQYQFNLDGNCPKFYPSLWYKLKLFFGFEE